MDELKKFIKKNAKKICINRKPVTDTPWKYVHPDHYRMAMNAYNNGEKYYYYEPVNKNYPNGELRESEPKFIYAIHMELSEKEYDKLTK